MSKNKFKSDLLFATKFEVNVLKGELKMIIVKY